MELLKIDEDLHGIWGDQSPEKVAELEAQILADMEIRDSICTWNGFIVDGHTRFKIAQKHGFAFNVHQMKFASKAEAMVWIYKTQKSRRNTTPQQDRIAYGKAYNQEKADHGGDRKSSPHCGDLIGRTKDYIADEAGVSPHTIERAGKEAESFGKLAAALQTKYEAGELCTVPQLHRLATLSKIDQLAKYKRVNAGKSWATVLPAERKPPKKTKASKGKVMETSSAKLADNLIRKFCSPLVRGIDTLATAIGGKGAQYKKADKALNELLGAIKAMRKGTK